MEPLLRKLNARFALVLAAALGLTVIASCGPEGVPSTALGSDCSSDDDCDPGDNCINGFCVGDSAGPDGGSGGEDAGAPDAGEHGGDDAGPATDAGEPDDAGAELDGGSDAGSDDAGTHDGGIDAGSEDAGTHDGGTDAGSEDAGTHDGGTDAGSEDAGTHDGGTDAGSEDGGSGEPDGGVFDGGPIGPTGGAVDLLDVAFTGDTRPTTCSSTATYPSAAFAQIVQSMASLKPQFGFDLGDHMYVCSQDATAAKAQMALYVAGLKGFTAPFFMTMGNHECEGGADCSATPTDANYAAYLAALKQVSKESLPYYALQLKTRLGRATFVFIADDYFDSTAQTWLQDTLTDADNNSAYTIIIKHHPVTGSRMGPTGPLTILETHHYSLILTAHDHDYAHTLSSFSGRSVICGLGGANAANTGFCRIQQNSDGTLLFTEYDISANPLDSWSVGARQ